MGIKMLLEALGIDLEEILKYKNKILELGEQMEKNQTIEKIIALPETLERIEKKLDSVLEKLNDGKSTN
jgi:hypothetical protein